MTIQPLSIAAPILVVAATGAIQIPVVFNILFKDSVRPAVETSDRVFRATPEPEVTEHLEERIEAAFSQEPRYSLEISEEEVNSFLATEFAEGRDILLRDVYIEFTEGTIVATRQLVQPFTTGIEIKARLEKDRNGSRLHIDEAKAGVLSIPGFVPEQLNSKIDLQIQKAFADGEGSTIEDIEILSGKLVLPGQGPTEYQVTPREPGR